MCENIFLGEDARYSIMIPESRLDQIKYLVECREWWSKQTLVMALVNCNYVKDKLGLWLVKSWTAEASIKSSLSYGCIYNCLDMKQPLVMSEVEKSGSPKDIADYYEFQPKDTVLTMRLSSALLDKVKEQAKLKNMDYQKYIRLVLEKNINKKEEV